MVNKFIRAVIGFFVCLLVLFSIGYTMIYPPLGSPYFYDNVLKPAYWSYYHVCGVDTQEEADAFLEKNNLYVAGTYTPSQDSIVVSIEVDGETLRHEQCHQQQYYEGRLYSCDHPFFYYLNEVECYIKEKNPEYEFYPPAE